MKAEEALHRQVAAVLSAYAAPGVVWWHTPNGERRDPVTASKLSAMGVRPGVPDIVIIVRGRTYGLELKSGEGRVSRAQEDFIAAAEGAGMHIEVARSFGSACRFLARISALAAMPGGGLPDPAGAPVPAGEASASVTQADRVAA